MYSSPKSNRISALESFPSVSALTPFPWPAENVPQLIPEPGSALHSRVLQYRELLDSLPMDAYTHGCILHPELTTDSMIPKYATTEIRSKSVAFPGGCPGLPSSSRLHSPASRRAPAHLPFLPKDSWEVAKHS